MGALYRHFKFDIAARTATAIACTGASIEMIKQGSSEVSLVFGIHQEDEDKILGELYKEFFSKVKHVN